MFSKSKGHQIATDVQVKQYEDIGKPLSLSEEWYDIVPQSVTNEFELWQGTKVNKFNKVWTTKQIILKEELQLGSKKNTKEAVRQHAYQRWEAWQRVLTDLKDRRDGTFKAHMEARAAQVEEGVDNRVARAGRFVSFPLLRNLHDTELDRYKTPISWTASGTTHEAFYYKLTCWFGELVVEDENGKNIVSPKLGDEQVEPPGEVSGVAKKEVAKTIVQPFTANRRPRLEPFGETIIFIAAEFYESAYAGAPHLRGLHLRDRLSSDSTWAYLEINADFHFGQDAPDPSYRYLVYHPFYRERNIPQKSFHESVAVRTARAVARSAAEGGNEKAAAIGAVAGVMIDIAYAFRAHPLHRFVGKRNSQADNVAAIMDPKQTWHDPLLDLQQTMAGIKEGADIALSIEQSVEDLKIDQLGDTSGIYLALLVAQGDHERAARQRALRMKIAAAAKSQQQASEDPALGEIGVDDVEGDIDGSGKGVLDLEFENEFRGLMHEYVKHPVTETITSVPEQGNSLARLHNGAKASKVDAQRGNDSSKDQLFSSNEVDHPANFKVEDVIHKEKEPPGPSPSFSGRSNRMKVPIIGGQKG